MLMDHCWNQALEAVDLYPHSPTKLKKSRKLSTRMTLGFRVRGIFLWCLFLLRLDYSMATCGSCQDWRGDFTATCTSREEQTKLKTIKTPAMDPGYEDVISDFRTFVNGKKFYKRKGKTWKRGYLLYEAPGSDGASLIAAMADFLEFNLYNLDLASFSSFSELKNTLLVGTWSSSVIAIHDPDDFDHCAGMLPILKNELKGSCLLEFVNGLLSSCGDEQIIVFTTNNKDRHDAARRRHLNEDIYVHKSSPQPVALADEGGIEQLNSSRQKPLEDFVATNIKAYQSSLLVSNSEEKNTREASARRCMTESVCKFVDSITSIFCSKKKINLTSISSMDFDALDNRAQLGGAYHSGPIVFNSETKDTREGLSGECSTKSALSFDDSTKRKSWPVDVNLSSFSEHASQDFDDFDFVGFEYGAGIFPNLKEELDSSREKPLVDFDAPNIKAHGLLVSNSEEKNMRAASTRWCMTESVCSLVDSMPSISPTDSDALDKKSHLGGAYQSGPILFNSEQKDMREGLSGQWLTKSAPSFDDKQKLLLDVRILASSLELTSQVLYDIGDFDDFDGFDHCAGRLPNLDDEFNDGLLSSCGDEPIILSTTNCRDQHDAALLPFVNMDTYIHTSSPQPIGKIVQLESSEQKPLEPLGRGCWDSMELEQPGTLEELGMDPENGGIISDFLGYVRKKESCKKVGKAWTRFYMFYEPPGTHRSSLIAAMVNYLKFDIYDLDLTSLSSVRELQDMLFSTTNRSLIAIRDFDHCATKLPILENEVTVSLLSVYVDDLLSTCGDERIIIFTTTHRNRHDAALLLPVNVDIYVQNTSPQPVALPDEGETVQIDSSEHKPLVDFDATSNRTYKSGVLVSNSEKKNTRGASKRQCMTKSVPSFDAPDNGAHLVGAHQSTFSMELEQPENEGIISDLLGFLRDKEFYKQIGKAWKRGYLLYDSPCTDRSSLIAAMANRLEFDIYNLDLTGVSSISELTNVLVSVRNCSVIAIKDFDRWFAMLPNRQNEVSYLFFSANWQHWVYCWPGRFENYDSLALKSFEVLDSLPLVEQSNLPRSLQRDCSGGLAAQSDIGLPDGWHILSLSEKKIVRKTLKRKCRNMSGLSLEDHQQHVGNRWEDDVKFLGAKRICRQLAIHRESTAKRIRRQHGTRQWPFKQSAINLPDGGLILYHSKKKIVRKTLKRKCRTTSVLGLDYHQHVDIRWEDAVSSLGAKRIHRQHGIHQWLFQQGHSLGHERPFEVMSLSADGKLVSRLQRIHISWLGSFAPRPSALPGGGESVGPIALSSSEFASTNNKAQRFGQDKSGSAASDSKKKRTREQEDGEEINTSITLDDLRQHYGRKRKDVAESLGVSVSTLKRTCRQYGIKRWPNIIRKKAGRPPDQHGEKILSPTCKTLSTNGLNEMENEIVGHLEETNEFLLDFVEGPNGGVSSEWAFELRDQWTVSTSYPNSNGPEVPHPHIASTQILGENIGSLGDRRNSFGSLEEHILQGHISGSMWTVPPCSDPASSQHMPTITPTMGSSEDQINSLAFLEDVFLEEDVSGSISWTIPTCSEPAPSQLMPSVPRTSGSSDDLGNLLPSVEECFSARHVSGFINGTVPSCSYPGPSQPMSIVPHTTGSSDALRNFLASAEEPFGAGHVSESINLTVPSCFDPAPSQFLPTIPHTMPTTPQMMPLLTGRQDMGSVRLKAIYGNTTIKFHFPLLSGFSELKEEVSKRLEFERGSFKLEYKDEEGDSVLIGCDEDVRDYLRLLNSLGNQVIKLFVLDKVPNTTNSCDNCGSLKCNIP